jgi:hypothetical protein
MAVAFVANSPDPEVPEKAQRRKFNAEDKKRIQEDVDCAMGPGGIGAVRRREGIYSSTLHAWRKADLGVIKTHSRPHVSDDNPYSGSQFRTPGFPARFGSIEDPRGFCQSFFRWYNHQHHHSDQGLMTPAMVHHGRAAHILAHRQVVLDAAFRARPERFVRKPPRQPELPSQIWINRPPSQGKTP